MKNLVLGLKSTLAARIGATLALSFASAAILDGGPCRALLSCTFGDLSACNGTVDNLKIENFQIGGGSTGFQAGDAIFIYETGNGNYEVYGVYRNPPADLTGLTGSGSFSFTATALNGFAFEFASVDSQSSSTTFSFSNSFSSFTGSPITSIGGIPAGPISPSTPSLTTTNIVVTWSANGDVATNSLIVLNTTEPVPGPLPILGAAAAFGFSRKIRARAKGLNDAT